MLVRNTEIQPRESYYADTLNITPSIGQSVYHNYSQGYATPAVAALDVGSVLAQKPLGESLRDAYEATNLENEAPHMGYFQTGVGYVANMIGATLNPINWGFGKLGSAIVERATKFGAEYLLPDSASILMRKPLSEFMNESVGKHIPKMIGKEGEEKTLSLALMGKKGAEAFGAGVGFGLPQGIAENYNADKNDIAFGGVARSMGVMGALGIAIGSVPFAFGVIRGKINRGLGEQSSAEITLEKLNKALENKQITPDEHAWYTDYLAAQKNPHDLEAMQSLKERGSKIVGLNGHDVNTATNEVPHEILTADNMKNLQSATADQLVGDVPQSQRNALSDFIVHDRFDNLRDNANRLDGVRGFVDFINEKIAAKTEKLKQADKILDDHLERGISKDAPLSQENLFKSFVKHGISKNEASHLPISIPERVKQSLQIERHVKKLNEKIKLYKKLLKKTGNERYGEKIKQTEINIEEEKKGIEHLHPIDELKEIREKLLTKNGLAKNHELTPEYHRLVDLAHSWKPAKTLLDRVNLEHEYNSQEAYKTLAEHTLRVADSTIDHFSKIDQVADYLKSRIEGNFEKPEPIEDVLSRAKESQEMPQDAMKILDEQENAFEESRAEDAKKEYEKAHSKFKEFKKSGNIFTDLLSCVAGALNG